jgi:3-isopropylmalate/(R)-2-methylmalate dehydratase small subunit
MKLQPFTRIEGHAAALPEDNVDTDIIFPARYLLLTTREGLGLHAFHDRRYHADGTEIASFVLNREPFRDARVIVAGANFGSGSSREQAVWTLLDFGIRAVIASSFGEIFHANCMRNGVLPLTFDPETGARLATAAEAGAMFAIDLEAQQLTVSGMAPLTFTLPSERREAMLNGWDETDQIENRFGGHIAMFEAAQRASQPWLYPEETLP